MDWQDTGILLTVRPHGETSVIADIFTAEHGRHAGIIRGGISRKMKPMLQPGAQLRVHWQARLESHLGSYRAELERSRAADVMSTRLCLEGANAIFSLLSRCLPEREPLPYLYAMSVALLDHIEDTSGWLADYVRWEAALLGDVGFGLDLDSCAATGGTQDLVFVSPKSGRAVSAAAGAPYQDKLLKLPAFMANRRLDVSDQDVLDGLALTGYFLQNRVIASVGGSALPDARARLVDLIRRRG